MIVIGTKIFKTKKSAEEAIKAVLHGAQLNTPLIGEAAEFIEALLEMHPERDLKVGAGVNFIFVALTEFRNRCFWIRRDDASATDFSYRACLKPSTKAQEAIAGFRTEIRSQIQQFKKTVFAEAGDNGVVCTFTGEQLTLDGCHVDHEILFADLVERFLAGRSLETVKVNATDDGDCSTRIADRTLAAEWFRYHRENAKLRVVSRRANLSILKTKRTMGGGY